MNRRSRRLDDLVRRANRIDESMMAALGDSVAKQALFEEIARMQAHAEAPEPTRRKPRLRLAVAATAGLAVVAIALAIAFIPRGDSQPPPAALPTGPSGDVFGPVMSCVEGYSEQAVTARAFAFDGTVTAIGQPVQKGLPDPYVPVTLRVNEWYKGGQGDSVTVAMFPPQAVTTVGSAEYKIGSRLLVSGEPRFGGGPLNDPVAWACGFTRWHTEADAAAWKRALS